MVRRIGTWFGLVIVAILSTCLVCPASAQSPVEEAAALDAEALRLYRAGSFSKAIVAAERSARLRREHLPEGHFEIAIGLNTLGLITQEVGRLQEAEGLYVQALAITEAARPVRSFDLALMLSNLALLHQKLAKWDEAEAGHKRALKLLEASLPPDHLEIGQSLNNLSSLYLSLGRFDQAEQLQLRALAILRKQLPAGHPDIGQLHNNLGSILDAKGEVDAEFHYRLGLEIRENALPHGHPLIAASLNNLAGFYVGQGKLAEAESLYKRALSIKQKVLPSLHPEIALAHNNLGLLFQSQGRFADAEFHLRIALEIAEKSLPDGHPDIAFALDNLALPLASLGRLAEGGALLRRGLEIRERGLPEGHPLVALSLSSLGGFYRIHGQHDQAAMLLDRALSLRTAALPADHPEIAQNLVNLAVVRVEQRQWELARSLFERSSEILKKRAMLASSADSAPSRAVQSDIEASLSALNLRYLVKIAHQMVNLVGARKSVLIRDAFVRAQSVTGTEAARSLAQMASRGASGDPELTRLARDRQDLATEWRQLDGLLAAAVVLPQEGRNKGTERAHVDRLAVIENLLAGIDRRLASEFPEFVALSRSRSLSVEEVQSALAPAEAMVLVLDTAAAHGLPEETFIWVITKNDVRWVRSELGTRALAREVRALRCGLDTAAWAGDGEAWCRDLLKVEFSAADARAGQPLPFDAARSHALYLSLFGEAEDLLLDKHLLIVPSGALTQLPFHVLVTAPPAGDDHKTTAWLARRNAISILPAVSSLASLRRVVRPSTGTRPMIGFGNPLLDGDQKHPENGRTYAELAALAVERSSCEMPAALRNTSSRGLRRATLPMSRRDSHIDPALLRIQSPLPETADELCQVARELQAGPDDVRLGASATERNVKALSASGELAKYRVVHFATHGSLAGQLRRDSEPGLILTPPAEASEEEDGFLSASEVASLKLDADWVILSACNTAGSAGGGEGAESLSGLARAFFYAQARALLVSHWEVDTDAAVKLIVAAVGANARDAGVGRAEGLRRAMLALIDGGTPREGHPAYWAPFVLVGEGGNAPKIEAKSTEQSSPIVAAEASSVIAPGLKAAKAKTVPGRSAKAQRTSPRVRPTKAGRLTAKLRPAPVIDWRADTFGR